MPAPIGSLNLVPQRSTIEVESLSWMADASRAQLAPLPTLRSTCHLIPACIATVVILVTSLYGGQQSDLKTRLACEVQCARLWRGLTGQRATNRDWKRITELGSAIADEGWSELGDIETAPIMMRYSQ